MHLQAHLQFFQSPRTIQLQKSLQSIPYFAFQAIWFPTQNKFVLVFHGKVCHNLIGMVILCAQFVTAALKKCGVKEYSNIFTTFKHY